MAQGSKRSTDRAADRPGVEEPDVEELIKQAKSLKPQDKQRLLKELGDQVTPLDTLKGWIVEAIEDEGGMATNLEICFWINENRPLTDADKQPLPSRRTTMSWRHRLSQALQKARKEGRIELDDRGRYTLKGARR